MRPDTPPAINDFFVGTWRLTVMPEEVTVMEGGADAQESLPGQPFPALLTLASDGTVAVAQPPMTPAAPGMPFQALVESTAVGVWETTGEDAMALTIEGLVTNETGASLFRARVRGSGQLSEDRHRWRGPFRGAITDEAAGTVILENRGEAEASRMALEPLT